MLSIRKRPSVVTFSRSARSFPALSSGTLLRSLPWHYSSTLPTYSKNKTDAQRPDACRRDLKRCDHCHQWLKTWSMMYRTWTLVKNIRHYESQMVEVAELQRMIKDKRRGNF